MSLPYYKFVPVAGAVVSPAFTTEKKHALLAVTNSLIGTSTPYLVFSGNSAVKNFAKALGTSGNDYKFAQKYFGFLSKSGFGVQKLLVARWYKEQTAPFIKGTSNVASLSALAEVSSGSIGVSFDGDTAYQAVVDLSSVASYSDVASALQTSIRGNTSGGTAYTGATVAYNSVTGGFIITSGLVGSSATVSAIVAGTTGTDLTEALGLNNAELSQGADAESYAEFCDRVFNANCGAFSITTNESLTENEIEEAVAWLQGTMGGEQTVNTLVRLVFNINDKETAKALQSTLTGLSYTGYVVCYDPYGELVHALDCAICGAIDYNVANGSINFNFQPAVGYTPITTLGTVVDYQQGNTNMSLAEELDNLYISYIYSVGFGEQEQVFYGMGLMAGAYGTEDVQVNESWIETDLQTRVLNGFASLEKLKLQGDDAKEFIASIISPTFVQAQENGSIARNGTLSDTDRNSIAVATNNANASDAVANNGFYFQVQNLTTEDIRLRRVRVLVCYLCGGVVNKIVITNRIYGA